MQGVVRFLAFTPANSRHEVSFWTISGALSILPIINRRPLFISPEFYSGYVVHYAECHSALISFPAPRNSAEFL